MSRYDSITPEDILLLAKKVDEYYKKFSKVDFISYVSKAKISIKYEKNMESALYDFVEKFMDDGLLAMPLNMMPLFINADATPIRISNTMFYVHKTYQILARWRLEVGL